jgi:hypothetical protein
MAKIAREADWDPVKAREEEYVPWHNLGVQENAVFGLPHINLMRPLRRRLCLIEREIERERERESARASEREDAHVSVNMRSSGRGCCQYTPAILVTSSMME